MDTVVGQSQQLQSDTRLTERQRAILRLIVHEYVSSGRPVGSKGLTERHRVGYSPATIRNEMAALEQAGLVEHLHTSGGRVPTSMGYRFYVKHLMGDVELPIAEQVVIRTLFRQVEAQLDTLTELAAATLAELAGNVAVVTAPRTAVPKVRHLELISLQPTVALLVLVTFDSSVRQAMVHLPEAVSQDALSRLADRLSDSLKGKSSAEMLSQLAGTDQPSRAVIERCIESLGGSEPSRAPEISSKGLENLVGQSDLQSDDFQVMFQMVNGGQLIQSVAPLIESPLQVQVFIGDDALPAELRRFGMIFTSYGTGEGVNGLLGILGPTRMTYSRSISTVRYMAKLMSDLVLELKPAND